LLKAEKNKFSKLIFFIKKFTSLWIFHSLFEKKNHFKIYPSQTLYYFLIISYFEKNCIWRKEINETKKLLKELKGLDNKGLKINEIKKMI